MFPLKDNIPTRRFPILTVGLIVANLLMFFFFQEAQVSFTGATVDRQNVEEYGAIPYEITHPGQECPRAGAIAQCADRATVEAETGEEFPPFWVTLFTSMFMHGGLLHLFGNMLFLWIFGNNIEDSMGRIRFVVFYLAGGLIALGAQTLFDPDSAVPTIGASGAIAAVLGGYAVLYPRARVVTLLFIIFFVTVFELPALLVLGFWFLEQLYLVAVTDPVGIGGGVAYLAHIGGFVFGLLAIKAFANRVHRDYELERRLPVY